MTNYTYQRWDYIVYRLITLCCL